MKQTFPLECILTLVAALSSGCLDLRREPTTIDAATNSSLDSGGGAGKGGASNLSDAHQAGPGGGVDATTPPLASDASATASDAHNSAPGDGGQAPDKGSAPDTRLADAGNKPDEAPPSCASPPMDYDLPCGCAADGRTQCDGTCSTPDNRCIPTGESYVLTNHANGDNHPLDSLGAPTFAAIMATQPGSSGQRWSITLGSDGYYRLTNMFLGPGRSLEASADGFKIFMGSSTDSAAQKWRIRAFGNEAAKNFRLLNALVGDKRSLDAGQGENPYLNHNGNFSGEYWKLTKAP
jgi:hypothetical protein